MLKKSLSFKEVVSGLIEENLPEKVGGTWSVVYG